MNLNIFHHLYLIYIDPFYSKPFTRFVLDTWFVFYILVSRQPFEAQGIFSM